MITRKNNYIVKTPLIVHVKVRSPRNIYVCVDVKCLQYANGDTSAFCIGSMFNFNVDGNEKVTYERTLSQM